MLQIAPYLSDKRGFPIYKPLLRRRENDSKELVELLNNPKLGLQDMEFVVVMYMRTYN